MNECYETSIVALSAFSLISQSLRETRFMIKVASFPWNKDLGRDDEGYFGFFLKPLFRVSDSTSSARPINILNFSSMRSVFSESVGGSADLTEQRP